MIHFQKDEFRFNFRSAAVVIVDNHLLVHQAEGDNFWALPGGRVEIAEMSSASVLRELKEEIAMEAKLVRALWHVENLYSYKDRHYHELATYYLVEPTYKPANLKPFEGFEPDMILYFKWLPLNQLPTTDIRPAFLKHGILNLPDEPKFIYVNELPQ